MEIGTKLLKLRKSLGLNQEKFAEYAGISKSAISQWETGTTTPGLEQLLKLRSNLAFSLDELLCDECREPASITLTTKKENGKILLFERKVVNIPIFSASESMGSGEAQHGHETIVGDIRVSKEWVEENLKGITSIRNLTAMTGKGSSMSPTYKDGDILIVDTGVKTFDVDGVYVFSINDDLFVIRIRKRLDGKLEVSSDNPIVKSYDICEQKEQLNIYGLLRLAWNCNKVGWINQIYIHICQETQMNIKILTLTSLMTLFSVTPALAKVIDDNVPLSKIPEKVQHTIKKYTQGGMIENVEKRTMKKKVIVYEAEIIKPHGESINIIVEEDGTFVEMRQPHKIKSH